MVDAIARGAVLDRYRLEQRLGAGAFGEVWLASETGGVGGFERKVAVKLITAVSDPKKVAALLHEAKICSAVQHPHVVGVEGVVQTDDAHFIVMEYVEGEDVARIFRDLARRSLRFPRSVVVDIGIAVCEALHAAWTAVDEDGEPLKIVHRDLKPHNVLLSDRGEVKVADFGIAKAAPDVTMTATGVLKGTPTYGPPELWMGSRDFKPATDLFGVGVMLWELATGRRFYGTSKISEVLDIMAGRTPDEEQAAVAETFPELAEMMPALLDRDPDTRVNDAAAVARRLLEIKAAQGAPGGVAEFLALVRGARVQRTGSTVYEPKVRLTGDLKDWEPLLEAARKGAPLVHDTVRGRRSRPGAPAPIASPDAETTSHGKVSLSSGALVPWLAAGLAVMVLIVLLKAKGLI